MLQSIHAMEIRRGVVQDAGSPCHRDLSADGGSLGSLNATGMYVNPMPLVDNRSASPNHVENALRDVYRRSTEMLCKQGNGKQLQLSIVSYLKSVVLMGKSKRFARLTLGSCLSVACQGMLLDRTSNIWRMLHSKSM